MPLPIINRKIQELTHSGQLRMPRLGDFLAYKEKFLKQNSLMLCLEYPSLYGGQKARPTKKKTKNMKQSIG